MEDEHQVEYIRNFLLEPKFPNSHAEQLSYNAANPEHRLLLTRLCQRYEKSMAEQRKLAVENRKAAINFAMFMIPLFCLWFYFFFVLCKRGTYLCLKW